MIKSDKNNFVEGAHLSEPKLSNYETKKLVNSEISNYLMVQKMILEYSKKMSSAASLSSEEQKHVEDLKKMQKKLGSSKAIKWAKSL